MKGFSRTKLMYMRAFAAAWPDVQIVQQAVGQMPWGHNLVLLTQLKDPVQRLAYAESAIRHGWTRNLLKIHIETGLLERSGKAAASFDRTLPKPQPDPARESLKDRYHFDFLSPGREANKRAFENTLVKHVTEFLLEMALALPSSSGKFKPEPLGQLSFYLTAVDEQLKHPQDNPTIGLLLCKSKKEVVTEYALRRCVQDRII